MDLGNIWQFRLWVRKKKPTPSLKRNTKMTFYHFWSIFDNKIQKNKKNASRSVEMLVFCVNMNFNLNQHHWVMCRPILTVTWSYKLCQYIGYFKNFSEYGHFSKIRLFQKRRLQIFCFCCFLTCLCYRIRKSKKKAMGLSYQS